MTGFIYAIESGGLVKIGWSRDPRRRLDKIRSDAPQDCELLGTRAGTRKLEAEFHHKLAPYRARREWFRNDGAVSEFIQSLFPHPKKGTRLEAKDVRARN